MSKFNTYHVLPCWDTIHNTKQRLNNYLFILRVKNGEETRREFQMNRLISAEDLLYMNIPLLEVSNILSQIKQLPINKVRYGILSWGEMEEDVG